MEKKHFFVNLSLNNKFRLSFLILIIISVCLVTVGITNIKKQVGYGENIYNYSAIPNKSIAEMSIAFQEMVIYVNDAVESSDIYGFDASIAKFEENQQKLLDILTTYASTIEAEEPIQLVAASSGADATTAATAAGSASADATTAASAETTAAPAQTADATTSATTSYGKTESIKAINDVSNSFTSAVANMREHVQNHSASMAKLIFIEQIRPSIDVIAAELNALLAYSLEDANSLQAQMHTNEASSITIMLIAMAIAILFAILIASLMSHLIIRPIKLVSERAQKVAEGYFETTVKLYGNDEIGVLSRSVNNVSKTYMRLISEMTAMVEAHEDGQMNYRIDVDKFEASYHEAISKINSMVESYTSSLLEILACVDEIGKGNFEATLTQYNNEKEMANVIVDCLREELKRTSSAIGDLVACVKDGNLSERAPIDEFNGGWKAIVENLNQMMDEIAAPINESAQVLKEFSQGNLNVEITGRYSGSFNLIKSNVNETLTSVASYMKEISEVLSEINQSNLNIGIERDYLGDFRPVKDSINQIVDKFNSVLDEINSASDQVSDGAKKISESSTSLASGVAAQNESVISLTSTIEAVLEKTHQNSENANSANEISAESKKNALLGNEDMKKMLSSMEEIKLSSSNISKIIKVIEDIAFQTDILALNAAVEAARAGVHGKGFAVVAEEVRNLAGRSKKAANETTQLIEDSIARVNEGTESADATAKALDTIVQNISDISDIVYSIAKASTDQANDISEISNGISKISDIVQDTAATSQESAAASQELFSQSETLKNMTKVFSLKK